DTVVYSLAVGGQNLFAGTWGGGVFLSTNNGMSWTAVNTGFTPLPYVAALTVSETSLYAGTEETGIWRRPLSDFGISSVPQHPVQEQTLLCYPNPLTESTTISF